MPSLSSYKEPSDPRLVDQAYGYNPLFDIFKANDLEALEEFIEKHSLHDESVLGGLSDVFQEAIACGSVDIYRRLVAFQKAQDGASSDWLPPPDQPMVRSDFLSPPEQPLVYACRLYQVDMVRYLLSTLDDAEAGISTAALPTRGCTGYTPLLVACSGFAKPEGRWSRKERPDAPANLRRCEEIVGSLLDRGSSVQDRACRHHMQDPPEREGPELYETVLSLAITNAGPDLIRRLIGLGAPLQLPLRFPEEPTVRGATLMHIAATYANVEAIEILLGMPEGRAMMTGRDGEGRLPMHWASGCSDHDVFERPVYDEETTASRVTATLKLLLPHSPVNDRDSLGNTPLHYAAHRLPMRLDNTIRVLLERGADPSLANHEGETPAHVAPRCQTSPFANYWKDVSQEIEKAFDVLEAASGNANLRDRLNNAGMTPRGIFNKERADVERRVLERKEFIARGRGRGRGGGTGRGRGRGGGS